MKLDIDKQSKMSYLRDKKFSAQYDGNWKLHIKSFLMICSSYQVAPPAISRMFRMTVRGSALALFDTHFGVDKDNWPEVDAVFKNCFYSQTKREEVSDETAFPLISHFRKYGDNEKDVLKRLVGQIATLSSLAVPSDSAETVQPKLSYVSTWNYVGLNAEKGEDNNQTYQNVVGNRISLIRDTERNQDKSNETGSTPAKLCMGQKGM